MLHVHEPFMKRCIALAEKALSTGNPPVGALLVHQGQVIGLGVESSRATGDITFRAEISAIRHALAGGFEDLLTSSCLYTIRRPCIMCSYAIRHYRIPYIVYGTDSVFDNEPTSALNVLKANSIPLWKETPKIIKGVCQEACEALINSYNQSLLENDHVKNIS